MFPFSFLAGITTLNEDFVFEAGLKGRKITSWAKLNHRKTGRAVITRLMKLPIPPKDQGQ